MKKRNLSIGSRPGPPVHASISPFTRPVSIPGRANAPRPIESTRPDAKYTDFGSQQESQSKHPFLSRSCHPYSSQSQPSLSQGCITQSQVTQRFSQNSQPEENGCDQWKKGIHDKDIISLSQPQKPPSPYFAGLASSLNLRNVPGNVGGGQTTASSTPTSAALCLVGSQNIAPRPWPQCNVSEELEKRLGNLVKLREEEAAVLQRICDDYQQIKTFLEETCFDSKDNRSRLSLQQNALHKLLKEEETANKSILSTIKASEEIIQQDIQNLKQVVEVDIANKITDAFKLMTHSFREELLKFRSDLKADLHAIEQPVHPIREIHDQLVNDPSQIQTKSPEYIPEHSRVPVSMPKVLDLNELPDSDIDIGLGFLVRDDSYPCKSVTKTNNQLDKHYDSCSDDNLRRSVRRKMLRAQRRVRCKITC